MRLELQGRRVLAVKVISQGDPAGKNRARLEGAEGAFLYRARWFVFLGTGSADIAFVGTMEVTAFQTQDTACARAGGPGAGTFWAAGGQPCWSAKPKAGMSNLPPRTASNAMEHKFLKHEIYVVVFAIFDLFFNLICCC